MRVFAYLHYFFYVAWNWGLMLALVVIYHEITGERKYRIHTIGIDELKRFEKEGLDISHATIYMPASYYVLEKMMQEIAGHPSNKSFLDIGSGKGRVMAVAAAYGFTRIAGVDFCKEFCDEATAVTSSVSRRNPVLRFTIVHQDASYYTIPPDITTIFLFNPFDEVILNRVLRNILNSQENNPRIIRVMYVNPLYVSAFLDAGFTQRFHFRRLNYFEGVILEKGPYA